MTKILAVSGSLRKDSFNSALIRAVAELAPEGVDVEIGSIVGIPLYDGDVEDRHGIPVAVQDLKLKIARADGLLIATPEYNHSIPGVLKNAFDWLSRPPADVPQLFHGKPVAITGASTGVVGTRMSQAAWLPTLRALGTNPWFGRLLFVPNASQAFDAEGGLIDDKLRKLVADWIREFADFAGNARRT